MRRGRVRQWLLFSTALLCACPRACPALSANVACGSGIATNVCLPKNYSSMDIPIRDGPNKISIQIDISDVLKIDDRDFSITFALYFNVQWREPRLQLNRGFFQHASAEGDEETLVPVNLNLIHDLWVPNVFIYNLKTFKVGLRPLQFIVVFMKFHFDQH
jgi:hypothetical protein